MFRDFVSLRLTGQRSAYILLPSPFVGLNGLLFASQSQPLDLIDTYDCLG